MIRFPQEARNKEKEAKIMDFHTVSTLGGYKSHKSLDSDKTLCGRVVSNSTGDWDPCKRCETAAAKLMEHADRTADEAARAAETQDDVMSQADHDAETAAQWADVDAGDAHYASVAAEPMLTDWERELLDAADAGDIPIIDADSTIGLYPDPDGDFTGQDGESEHGPAALPDTVTRLAANGHRMDYRVTGEDPDGHLRVSQWDATHSAACLCVGEGEDEGDDPVVSEYKIEITRHVVSYHAPDDHSQCNHSRDYHGEYCAPEQPFTGCQSCAQDCDSVDGRWLEGARREISPAETEVIVWDEEMDREQYGPGYGPQTLAAWVEHHLSPLGTFEPSGTPVGPSEQPHAWMSTSDGHGINATEIATEISVRLTDGWTPEERAFVFTHITGCK